MNRSLSILGAFVFLITTQATAESFNRQPGHLMPRARGGDPVSLRYAQPRRPLSPLQKTIQLIDGLRFNLRPKPRVENISIQELEENLRDLDLKKWEEEPWAKILDYYRNHIESRKNDSQEILKLVASLSDYVQEIARTESAIKKLRQSFEDPVLEKSSQRHALAQAYDDARKEGNRREMRRTYDALRKHDRSAYEAKHQLTTVDRYIGPGISHSKANAAANNLAFKLLGID